MPIPCLQIRVDFISSGTGLVVGARGRTAKVPADAGVEIGWWNDPASRHPKVVPPTPTEEAPMRGAASSSIGREAGRGLLTLANLITAAAPVAADWNDSHIFNNRWPAHARFHGVVALTMTSTLATLNLWSLWSGSTDRRTSRLFAAAVPVGYWAPFFVAPLVRGTGVDDPPHPIPRVAGVPTSLLGAAATTLTAVAGWLLDRRSR
jgi:hypothetical protein